ACPASRGAARQLFSALDVYTADSEYIVPRYTFIRTFCSGLPLRWRWIDGVARGPSASPGQCHGSRPAKVAGKLRDNDKMAET
ncbi:MAG: hypothetical protein ACRDOL_35575, partial [Streptosporangiaceae bacterium]